MNFNLDNHSGVVTHLEPDIFKCEVKWTLGSITTNKTSGGDRIPFWNQTNKKLGAFLWGNFKIALFLYRNWFACIFSWMDQFGQSVFP